MKIIADENLIPNDGSKEIIQNYANNLKSAEIIIYPDVHYKKGARCVNGILAADTLKIFPALLGTPNCGYIFGKIENVSINDKNKLEETFRIFSNEIKTNKTNYLTEQEVIARLEYKIETMFEQEKDIFEFLNIKSIKDAHKMINQILTPKMLAKSAKTLGNLGGGNHFFELQYINETYSSFEYQKDDIIFILHTDSSGIGNLINLIFSNLSELDYLEGYKGEFIKLSYRLKQFHYLFLRNNLWIKNPIETFKLIYSKDDYREIIANKSLGKLLITAYYIASLLGDINRDLIIENYVKSAKKTLKDIYVKFAYNHNHDSVNVIKDNYNYKIIHRNGVQNINDDSIYILPGALGTESYIMKNPYNKEVYYSANHGTGRLISKHISKSLYNDDLTAKELSKSGLKLFKIGNSSLAEQNFQAYKNIDDVVLNMTEKSLGYRIAKLLPICAIKE